MTERITVEDVKQADCPSSATKCLERSKMLCRELEKGNILFFPNIPFDFPKEDIEFLLNQKQIKNKSAKYKPRLDKLVNANVKNEQDYLRLHEVMKKLSCSSSTFLSKLLTPYASKWTVDNTCFRSFGFKGKKQKLKSDLLHIDAFKAKPMFGTRILKFYININPKLSKRWITSESFEKLVEKFGGSKDLPFPAVSKKSLKDSVRVAFKKGAKTVGLPVTMKSAYDHFMLKMQKFLKKNNDFQENCSKDHWEFPPGSCWAVFTDVVSHAVIEDQNELEQTFFIPVDGLIYREKAPISILERRSGWSMSSLF